MKNILLFSFIGIIVIQSCRKHDNQVEPPVPDPPAKAHFTSIFYDSAHAIISANSYGVDFATGEIKDTVFAGRNYLKILVKQKVDWGYYESAEIFLDKFALSTSYKGQYTINYNGSVKEPVNVKFYYNTNDPVNPVVTYTSLTKIGIGYVEIADYDKERKLLSGSFSSYARDVPSPLNLIITPGSRWDATLEGEFQFLKIK